MGLLLMLAIIGGVIYIVRRADEENHQANTPPEPPTEDVWIIGCRAGDCGYGSWEFYQDASGEWQMNNKVVNCKYQNKKVRAGSQCPFAKDHPELLRKGVFSD